MDDAFGAICALFLAIAVPGCTVGLLAYFLWPSIASIFFILIGVALAICIFAVLTNDSNSWGGYN
jgi:hypothetical protein